MSDAEFIQNWIVVEKDDWNGATKFVTTLRDAGFSDFQIVTIIQALDESGGRGAFMKGGGWDE